MQDERWREIKVLWKQNRWLYILAGFMAGLLVEPVLKLMSDDMSGFLQTLVPEAIGILFTVLFIDRLYRRQEDRQLKEQLIRELSSQDNGLAVRAVNELRAHSWLADGSLQGKMFLKANLQEADFSDAILQQVAFPKANLQKSTFKNADLEGAFLMDTDLRVARLENTNLRHAYLQGANLEEAQLAGVNLQDAQFRSAKMNKVSLADVNLQSSSLWAADLRGAKLSAVDFQGATLFNADFEGAWMMLRINLKGASLLGANLRNALFGHVEFDENTTLPDRSQWSSDNSNLERFTNPAHPEFWRSTDQSSPAYAEYGALEQQDTTMIRKASDLLTIVRREVEEYAGPVLLGQSFAISDNPRQSYVVLVVPDQTDKFQAGIIVLARVVDDMVIIDEDTTDRPLWKELVAAGVPRDKIILTYAGEEAPAPAEQ